MTDNQVLAIMAAIFTTQGSHVSSVAAARTAVAIGALFGVEASENTKMELLLGGDQFEQRTTTSGMSLPDFIQSMREREASSL